jgi:ATP-dependent HslUV protease ATP-binding subunit HslU
VRKLKGAGPVPIVPRDLTPREIVAELDRYIVGQNDAKRAVAIAIRNRWRRQHLPEELRQEVAPKNILMIGPTGVGKTEIARRLAKLTGAPFIKVEATKYTEVGYYGRDVESMVRELVENAIGLIKAAERTKVEDEANKRVEEQLLDKLLKAKGSAAQEDEEFTRDREKMREMLRAELLEDEKIELTTEHKATPVLVGGMGLDQMDFGIQDLPDKLPLPKHTSRRELPVSQARQILLEQETEALLDPDKVNAAAVELAENVGIIFIDELDKIVASETRGADVSRQGVQRDLLPIVEGTHIQSHRLRRWHGRWPADKRCASG